MYRMESTHKFGVESTHKFGVESTHKFGVESTHKFGVESTHPQCACVSSGILAPAGGGLPRFARNDTLPHTGITQNCR